MKIVITAFLIKVRTIKIIASKINFITTNNLNLILYFCRIFFDLNETTNRFVVSNRHTSMPEFNRLINQSRDFINRISKSEIAKIGMSM